MLFMLCRKGNSCLQPLNGGGNIPSGRMTLLQNGKSVSYTCKDGKVIVTVPKGISNEALAFSFKVK